MAHREDIRSYLESLTVSGLVLDWGAGSKPVERYVKSVGAKFVTIDSNPKCSPELLWNITQPLSGYEANYAFCMEALEHVQDPQAVADNIYSNLARSGVLHVSVPFMYPEHGDEDYWRFTGQGLELLAKRAGFKNIEIWEITDGFLMKAAK